jgi:hypothetical protein
MSLTQTEVQDLVLGATEGEMAATLIRLARKWPDAVAGELAEVQAANPRASREVTAGRGERIEAQDARPAAGNSIEDTAPAVTASWAERIEAQITLLTDVTEKLAVLEFIMRNTFDAGYVAGQEAAMPRRPRTPRKPAIRSHLTRVP